MHLFDQLGTHDCRRICLSWCPLSRYKTGRMSEPATNPAATAFPEPTISLPLGLQILRTYSGALICLEIVSVASLFLTTSFVSKNIIGGQIDSGYTLV